LGDEIRVRQVMLNLVNNAIKYTHEGSVSVDVYYEINTQMLQIVVADTGIGIKNEDLGKLFGSFQRLEEDKNRNIEGTGLGLNITMRLVKMMDGSIGVSSEYGKGTTFTAKMKQAVVDATPVGDLADNLARLQENKEEYRPSLIASNAKVLIVDDNEMNLEVIGALLTDTKIRVTTAGSGKECLEMIKGGNNFDLIFLDQMMPGMSGVQTLEAIKEGKLAEGIPIVALTADAIVGARDSYISEGFTDYLSKPVIYKDLEELLMRYLNRSLIEANEPKEESNEPEDMPVVIAVSDSSEKLKQLKALLGDGYKGVFVKDMDSAARYVEKNRNQ
jgi:CheY-like chemotaxis protein/anti-sigma regulatory factor (Ser/Thr protein kinase)